MSADLRRLSDIFQCKVQHAYTEAETEFNSGNYFRSRYLQGCFDTAGEVVSEIDRILNRPSEDYFSADLLKTKPSMSTPIPPATGYTSGGSGWAVVSKIEVMLNNAVDNLSDGHHPYCGSSLPGDVSLCKALLGEIDRLRRDYARD